jgi:hypothetical protein
VETIGCGWSNYTPAVAYFPSSLELIVPALDQGYHTTAKSPSQSDEPLGLTEEEENVFAELMGDDMQLLRSGKHWWNGTNNKFHYS